MEREESDPMSEDEGSEEGSPMRTSVHADEPIEPLDIPTAALPTDPAASSTPVCEECERSEPVWGCDVCEMRLCNMCFDVLHRKGKRAKHARKSLGTDEMVDARTPQAGVHSAPSEKSLARKALSALSSLGGHSSSSTTSSASSSSPSPPSHTAPPLGSSRPMSERAKYIPLRLSYEERRYLRLVEAAISVCDYTARVDKHFKTPAHREQAVLRQVTAILEGVTLSEDFKAGQELLEDRAYDERETFFQQLFEIARRYKIMNPEKMRTEYGKLVYMLQDAVSPAMRRHLQFNIDGGIRTVYKLLEEKGGLTLLDDPMIYTATQEILPDAGKTRAQIQAEIKRKERAIEHLADKYESRALSTEDIRLCLYSICDNISYLNSNRVPIDKMIKLLWEFFSPHSVEDGYSLSIVQGQDGARLTHSHERQFNFALQSLTLWREITDDMFRLWALAEADLLSTDPGADYVLKDTGQGLHRVQCCPRTFHAMQAILHETQQRVVQWIGSSVIHLGDSAVPNSLMYIDKYTSVPRILGPLVCCLEQVERIYKEDEGVKRLIDLSFGGLHKCKKDILYDFFKTAFDGSGGDNFFDAGSCIDGRLTSCWHWCQELSKKKYHAIFRLTGFLSFDGDFDR